MRDVLLTIAFLLLIVAGFYAFQLIVVLLVGLVIYYSIPLVKQILHRRKSWK